MFWKLAIVEQLIEGKDGHVQAAVIKVGESNSSRKGVTLKRSIKHLYPIEVKADDKESESDETLENFERSKEDTSRNRDNPEPIAPVEDRRP